MTALAPNSSGVETYEDMFKEITRKLYGEETGHGLHTLGTPVATHVSSANSTVPEGERSFTTLLSDRNTSIDYDPNTLNDGNNLFKNDDHLAAFGLALMQNGFSPHGAILNTHTFQQINKQQQQQQPSQNSINNLTIPTNITAMQQNQTIRNESIGEKWTPQQHDDDLNSWNNKPQNYQKIKKQENLDSSTTSGSTITQLTNNPVKITNNNSNANNSAGSNVSKRYSCTSCPYSTDRRDLYSRHENIHKEDKPFHCYVCLKQFNRADHVKKHFLRMHRSLTYEIGRTRRLLPQRQMPKKLNTATTPYFNQSSTNHSSQTTTLNIPSAFSTSATHSQHQPHQQSSIIDQTTGNLNANTNTNHPSLLTSNTGINSSTTTATTTTTNTQKQQQQQHQEQQRIKMEKNTDKISTKKKNDRRFLCCYCNWSGTDNWGLKRHLNTHTKPFICMLCDYKAARSERLVTHVFKVHNKKVCIKCNYLADNQSEYDTHIYEAHSHETRAQRVNQSTNSPTESSPDAIPTNNVLRNINNSFNITNTALNSVHNMSTSNALGWRSTSNTLTNNSDGSSTNQNTSTSTKGNSSSNSASQKRGAERLFQYLEADDSDPEDYSRQLQMAAISRNTATVAQDFLKAGGDNVKTTNNLVDRNKQSKASKLPLSTANRTNLKFIDLNVKTMQNIVSPPALNSYKVRISNRRQNQYLHLEKENLQF